MASEKLRHALQRTLIDANDKRHAAQDAITEWEHLVAEATASLASAETVLQTAEERHRMASEESRELLAYL